MVEVRRAREDEWSESRDLRLEMLADSPRAFVDSLDDALGWSDDRWRTRLLSHLADDSTLVVAVEGDQWVGQAAGRIFRTFEPERAYVLGVYVTPLCRGGGLAAGMIDLVAAWASGRGVDRLYLDVHQDAREAQSTYARQGFVATGHRGEHPNYPGEFEVEMVKALIGRGSPGP